MQQVLMKSLVVMIWMRVLTIVTQAISAAQLVQVAIVSLETEYTQEVVLVVPVHLFWGIVFRSGIQEQTRNW